MDQYIHKTNQLENLINTNSDIRHKLEEKIGDIEFKLKNMITNQGRKSDEINNVMETQIKEVKKQLGKKANQSDLDKVKDKVTKKIDTEIPVLNEQPRMELFESYKAEEKIKINEKNILLMDSNSNHIDINRFAREAKKIKISNLKSLKTKTEKLSFTQPKNIIIGVGTNDTDTLTPELIVREML